MPPSPLNSRHGACGWKVYFMAVTPGKVFPQISERDYLMSCYLRLSLRLMKVEEWGTSVVMRCVGYDKCRFSSLLLKVMAHCFLSWVRDCLSGLQEDVMQQLLKIRQTGTICLQNICVTWTKQDVVGIYSMLLYTVHHMYRTAWSNIVATSHVWLCKSKFKLIQTNWILKISS